MDWTYFLFKLLKYNPNLIKITKLAKLAHDIHLMEEKYVI